MSLLSPRRYQASFRPYRTDEDDFFVRGFTRFERLTKEALFGCRMCGNCILEQTALICPMTCPKGLRNGLCGGATPEACEVDPSRPCTWYLIYEKANRKGQEDRLLEVNAPLDGDRVGRETWLALFRTWRARREGPRLRCPVRSEAFPEGKRRFAARHTAARLVVRRRPLPPTGLRRTAFRPRGEPQGKRLCRHCGDRPTQGIVSGVHPGEGGLAPGARRGGQLHG